MCGEENWDVFLVKRKDGKITGSWPYYIYKRFGLRKYGQPDFTPYLGPYIVYPHNIEKKERILSHEQKVMQELVALSKEIKLFKQGFHVDLNNWMPFYWDGYTQTTRYTYLLDNIKQHDKIWDAFKSSVKTDIRRAEKIYDVKKEEEISKLFLLSQSTFDRKNETLPLSEKRLNTIYTTTKKNSHAEIFTAYANGEAHGSLMTVFDNRYAYCLLIGVDKAMSPKGAVQLLLWTAIRSASKRVDNFDFEGSMLKEVESIFRAFGGELKAFNKISKAPMWFKILYRLTRGKDFSL